MADEVVKAAVAFARHSTSLFSINDSPGTSSMRKSSGTVLPSLRRRRANAASPQPTSPAAVEAEMPSSIRTPPTLGKRRQSDPSPAAARSRSVGRVRIDEPENHRSTERSEDVQIHTLPSRIEDLSDPWHDDWNNKVDEADTDGVGVGDNLIDSVNPELGGDLAIDTGTAVAANSDGSGATLGAPGWPSQNGLIGPDVSTEQGDSRADQATPEPAPEPSALEDLMTVNNPDPIANLQDHHLHELLDDEDPYYTYMNDALGDLEEDNGEGPSMIWGPELDALMEEDYDEDEEMDTDREMFTDEDSYGFYDDIDDEDEDDEDDEGSIYPDRRSEETEFGQVEMISPRRIFKGAKNVETVKDCESNIRFSLVLSG